MSVHETHRPFEEWAGDNELYASDRIRIRLQLSFEQFQHDVLGSPTDEKRDH